MVRDVCSYGAATFVSPFGAMESAESGVYGEMIDSFSTLSHFSSPRAAEEKDLGQQLVLRYCESKTEY